MSFSVSKSISLMSKSDTLRFLDPFEEASFASGVFNLSDPAPPVILLFFSGEWLLCLDDPTTSDPSPAPELIFSFLNSFASRKGLWVPLVPDILLVLPENTKKVKKFFFLLIFFFF